ncbi:MAG TPA: hypothetical protein VNT03_19190 [Baekduia sp.]|nr:hypothetical protein [Baekduia sp.]
MTAPAFTSAQPPLHTRGMARFEEGIFEVPATGDDRPLRLAARDILAIDVAPACGARLRLTLVHRRGSQAIRHTSWLRAADHDHLLRLVATVRAATTHARV